MWALSFTGSVSAQNTSFTYQGRLTDNGSPANGQYDFQCKLFETGDVGTGTQQGSTFSVSNITVTAGAFTLQLDFGSAVFPGAPRFLEVAVKKVTDPSFVTLNARQPIGAHPYAIHTLNADALSGACSNCVTSNQIQSVQGSQVTGSIAGSQINGTIPVASLPSGSNNYIQNGASQQSFSDFNVSGQGTAGILNATLYYMLGGFRFLSTPGTNLNNLFVGVNTGVVNPTGTNNSFFGPAVGTALTSGSSNSFFGSFAGRFTTVGGQNSFFGSSAGTANSTGAANSFFGVLAGQANTTGSNNVFLGLGAGLSNTTGANNIFVGHSAGLTNVSGGNLTVIGRNANVGANNLNFATAIGAGAVVSADNTVVLGRATDTVQVPGSLNANSATLNSATVNSATLTTLNVGSFTATGSVSANILNATAQYNLNGSRILSAASENIFAGIGAGAVNTGGANSFFGKDAGSNNTTGALNSFFGHRAGASNSTSNFNSFFGTRAGELNTTGASNSYFGQSAGSANTTGSGNAFVGVNSGFLNTTGSNNTFIGADTGPATTTQVDNSTAIGAGARVSTSNTIVVGTASQTTRLPGYMTVGEQAGGNFAMQVVNSQIGGGVVGNNFYVRQLNQGGSPAHLCWKVAGDGVPALLFTTCTTSLSSLRYKTDFRPFVRGLEVINRLSPMTFTWKEGGERDFGLSAEMVAEVEPLLVSRNDKGEVEDVKEGSLNAVFINAFKEQQEQIKQQQDQIKQQQLQIESLNRLKEEFETLKSLVCATNPDAAVCKSSSSPRKP